MSRAVYCFNVTTLLLTYASKRKAYYTSTGTSFMIKTCVPININEISITNLLSESNRYTRVYTEL